MSLDHLMTYPGLRFLDPINPDPEQIELEDIANALSMLCRYGGHVPRFYSVAEHCVLLAQWTAMLEPGDKQMIFAALMHDAAEAYLVDVPRPIKRRLPEYRVIEDELQAVIGNKYGVSKRYERKVAEYDFRMLRTELDEMVGEKFVRAHFPHIHAVEPLEGIKLQYWEPVVAMQKFLLAYHHYAPVMRAA